MPRKQSLVAPSILLAVSFSVFVSIPYFLSRSSMSGPPRPAAAPEMKSPRASLGGQIIFRDVEEQAREFIGYYHSVELTPEQESVKKASLGALPAACCSGSTAYTCCCPCNLSKTIWGLSNYVITRHHVSADQLTTVVNDWLGFVNPDGFRGNACYQGGCESKASRGGCGGMTESKLAV